MEESHRYDRTHWLISIKYLSKGRSIDSHEFHLACGVDPYVALSPSNPHVSNYGVTLTAVLSSCTDVEQITIRRTL